MRIDGEEARAVAAGEPAAPGAGAPPAPAAAPDAPADDPVFAAEQRHLTETYATLQAIGTEALHAMGELALEAAADKEAMAEELATNYATWDDAMETHADFMALNRIIDGYNLAHGVQAQRLADAELLLRQPYFAKVVLRRPGEARAKEVYIGAAGISDDACRRLVVDWRSPVAEVYYNQQLGPTSYRVDGRVIDVELDLRRQFDIERDRLISYFDSDVAIEDSLLLASLSRQRSPQMQAITATIQKEQNRVVRHDDVDVLLVNGIAGSGKTSVLLQRIAYLFYRNRDTLSPDEVVLLTPNDVFSRYIEAVLPEMGERNPRTLTWAELAASLLPEGRGVGDGAADPALLDAIDDAMAGLEFMPGDFRGIEAGGLTLISADQVRRVNALFPQAAAGPHRVALIREELAERLESRLRSLAASDAVLDEIALMGPDEQVRRFGVALDPTDEDGAREVALDYVRERYAGAERAVDRDEWLDVDALAKRLLGTDGLPSVAWLYLKVLVTGMGDANARYVMVDEVQDYAVAQLRVLARYFRRAHFLLLGDPNQAIAEGTATFDQVRAVFEAARGAVDQCDLMISYRSTPAITALFARLAADGAAMDITSVQRDDEPPALVACDGPEAYADALRAAVDEARRSPGLTALIVPWRGEAKRIARALGDDAPPLLDDAGALPAEGVAIVPLKLAKGLEFDEVIVADASARAYPGDSDVARRRLYTALSRATRKLTVIAEGALTPWLA